MFSSHNKSSNILEKKKQEVIENYRQNALIRKSWVEKNKYYYDYIARILRLIVEPHQKVLLMKSDLGDFLGAVEPTFGLGLDYCQELVDLAQKRYPRFVFRSADFENLELNECFDYVLVVNLLDDIVDVCKHFKELHKLTDERTRIVIVNHNYLWYPLLKLGERLGLKMKQPALNWLSLDDVKNLLYLAGFEVVKGSRFILFPKYIPVLSWLLNRIVANLPFVNKLCFLQVSIAKKIPLALPLNVYSVSVVSPCRNEQGNIEGIVTRIPEMGKWTELILVDDKSTDDTKEEIKRFMKKFPQKRIKLVEGPGINKARAVWAGFAQAEGDILMILDGDLTVLPEELPYFYNAIASQRGEFINGSRMMYQMEKDAMRPFNVVGNKFFSLVFSYLLDRTVKDTLCGTKVFFRKDYKRMQKFFGGWGVEDRWGDYELLFSASRINLKIVDLPVHYVSRTYGETKMKRRLYNASIMLKMCWAAFKKFKYV